MARIRTIVTPLNMNHVQNLITAVNESRLPHDTKTELRTMLDAMSDELRYSLYLSVIANN